MKRDIAKISVEYWTSVICHIRYEMIDLPNTTKSMVELKEQLNKAKILLHRYQNRLHE